MTADDLPAPRPGRRTAVAGPAATASRESQGGPVPTIRVLYFAIGGTLGNRNAAGRLVPFDDSVALLRAARDALGLKLGVITG